MTLRVETLQDEAALSAVETAWHDLWERCPKATPFQSPAWPLPWWACFRPGDLRVVAVYACTMLVGLAPLYREAGAGGRLLLLGMSVSDELDVLVDPDHPAAATALVGAVELMEDWTRLDLEELPQGASALRLPSRAGWREMVSPQSACPVLTLPSDGDLAAAIPALKLRKLRMARRRAARRAWCIEEATGATLPAMLDALFRLHGERWHARGESGVLAGEDIRGFHRAAAPRLLAQGSLRLAALRLGDAVAGVYYGFEHGGRAAAYLGGFDPAFAFESPGTLLLGHAIERATARGVTEFSFLRGQEAYKYEWGAVDRWTLRRSVERSV